MATEQHCLQDYPRHIKGYAFEIDEPAVSRVMLNLPFRNFTYDVVTVCRKDSTEIDNSDRDQLADAIVQVSW